MIQGAGILFVTPDKQVLLGKRGSDGAFPGYWAAPGGHVEAGETPYQAACREVKEELGVLVSAPEVAWSRSVTPLPNGEEVDFITFRVDVPEAFTPTLNKEHSGYMWCPATERPEPMIPGTRTAMDRLSWNETETAKAVADGRLTSPQQFENVWLFNVRVTGTGTAFRDKLNEYVYRPPSEYLNDAFLERCQGLPIIVEHPENNMLDTKEFANRVVGTVVQPYIKGEEVWGVARIYDAGAAKWMTEKQISTSPAVVFRDLGVNTKIELESGAGLLIEGKPTLLDHLALCEAGVWDKGGPPTGVVTVDSLTRGDSAMADEVARDMDRKDEDRARSDAEAGEKLDKILSYLDSLSSRLDALETAAKPAACDAEGEAVVAEAPMEENIQVPEVPPAEEEVGEPAPVVADAEIEEMRGDSRALRQDIARLERMVVGLNRAIPVAPSDNEYAELTAIQAKADSVYAAFGDSAPRPLQGESSLAYNKRLINGLKKHSAVFSQININGFDAAAVKAAEKQVYADAMAAATSAVGVPEGVLRAVPRKDATGRTITEFHGKPGAWMRNFSSTRRYMTALNTNVR